MNNMSYISFLPLASDEIRVAVMDAKTDTNVLATFVELVADTVFERFEKRMSAYENELREKDKCIETLERNVSRMEVKSSIRGVHP